METINYEYRVLKQEGGKLPAVRTGAAPILHDGNLYLFQGFGAGVGRTSDVWRYGMKEKKWDTVVTSGNNSDKPTKRDGHSATYLGEGKVLIFGGQGEPSVNEKSERTLDIVKTKTWSIRDLYNDLFMYDCNTSKWEMLCPQGGVPLCRRGHSAMFFPPGGYEENQLQIYHPHDHHHHHSHHSPKKSKKGPDEDHNEYEPVPENSVVVFGGSGMEVSKYIEAVYNDLWVFSLDNGRWNKTKCRGIEPKPLFDHRVVRVGHLMLVIGGITATNARSAKGEQAMEPNHDVYLLNLKTLVWSTLEIKTHKGKAAKLNLHGHSLVTDPYNEGILYLFGGKDTIDGKKAALESIAGAKRLMRVTHDTHAWEINLKTAVMNPIPTKNLPPETRYEHIAVSGGQEGSFITRDPPPKRKPESREEPLMYLFGGARVESFGFCDPVMLALVRTFTYTYPDLMSQAGGSTKKDEIPDDASISTRHTEGSALTMGVGVAQYDEDSLRQPSIWEKKQAVEIQAGRSQVIREPSSWEELKLALSVSATDKRSAHGGKSTTLDIDTTSPSRPDTAESTDRPAPVAPADGGTEMALSAKAMRKKEIRRLRQLGQTILPIIKNKPYLDAKASYFAAYPAPMPERRKYTGKSTL